MPSHYARGKAREYRVRDWFADRGWHRVMQASSSKGVADLLMIHEDHGGALIQVGTAKSKRLGPGDRDRLVTYAELAGLLPLLATSGPGIPTRVWVVSRDVPSKWQEFPA